MLEPTIPRTHHVKQAEDVAAMELGPGTTTYRSMVAPLVRGGEAATSSLRRTEDGAFSSSRCQNLSNVPMSSAERRESPI